MIPRVSERHPRVGPSKIVGYLVLVAIMLFAALAAAGLLGWTAMVLLIWAPSSPSPRIGC